MKKLFTLSIILIVVGCTKPPFFIGTPPTLTFIDNATKSDTIIVKYNYEYNDLEPTIYFAKKNWQMSSSSVPNNGFKFIAIRTIDTISIPESTGSTNYYNYRFKFSADGNTLESQNFLLLPSASSALFFSKL